MDSPHNCFSPYSATKASPNRKFSSDSHHWRPGNGVNPEEIDENQQHAGKDVALKPQFQKKPAKNFMSPTISAASKVSAPRKKILTERNDCTPQPDDQSLPDSDSSSAPYDPLTNYLSPRPRFLRYNPNRRLQFLRTEKLKEELGLNGGSPSPESKEHKKSSSPNDSGDSLAHEDQEEQEGRSHQLPEKVVSESSQEEEEEDEEEEEEEDEEEEEEEKRPWRGRSVLRYVIVLSLLFFGLHFSSSVYPSSLLLSSQHSEGCDEGFLEIHDPLPFLRKSDLNNFFNQFFRLYKELSTFVKGSAFSTSTFVSFTGERTLVAHSSVVTNDGNLDLEVLLELPGEETLSAANNDAEEVSHSCLQSFHLEEQRSDDEISVVIPLGEELSVESDSSPLFESVLIGEASEFDDKVSFLIPFGEELIVESDSCPLFQSVQTGEASEFDDGHWVQQEEESMDVTEFGEDGGISEDDIDEVEEAETEKEISSQGSEVTEHTEMPELSESPTLPSESAYEPDQLPHSLSVRSSMMESTSQIPESSSKAMDTIYSESYVRTIHETVPNDQTSWTEFVKEKLSLETGLIVSLSLILAGSITFVFLRLKAKKASEPTTSSPSTTVLEEKKITSECLEREDKVRPDNSHINLSPGAQPLPADDFSPLYATRPPSVELLGEFELGEQVDSSGKDSSLHLKRASRAKSVRVSETTEQENWRASISFSSNRVKPSAQEVSTAESLSYGSFIVEGKLVKKQEGEAGISLVTTPVRRSSRIRNRVKSP